MQAAAHARVADGGRPTRWSSSRSTRPPSGPRRCSRGPDGSQRYMKGAPAIIAKLGGATDALWQPAGQSFVAHGQRVLAVAVGDDAGNCTSSGLLGLEDAVREDSRRSW